MIPCRFLISRGAAVEDQEKFQESRGFPACVVGTILMGIGAGFSLSFPETVLLQFPISSQLALSSICGILIAAIVFAMLSKLESFQSFLVEGRYFQSAFADQNFGLHYGLLAITIGLADLIALKVFNSWSPSKLGLDEPPVFRRSPYVAGTLLL